MERLGRWGKHKMIKLCFAKILHLIAASFVWGMVFYFGGLLFLARISPALAAENPCQDFLRRMHQIHRDNFYTNYRDIADYTQFLGLDFDSAIAALRHHELWLDAGAGVGAALEEYLQKFPGGGKVVGTGIDLAKFKSISQQAEFKDRASYVEGYMEDLAREKLQIFGEHYQLITDVFGPMMYSPHLDRILNLYGDLLAPGGLVMFILDTSNVHFLDDWHVERPLYEWFLNMEGLEVVQDPIFLQEQSLNIFLTVIMRRTYALLHIPRLTPMWERFKVGCPPQRWYVMSK